MLIGTYSAPLVAVSCLVAILAAYTALDLAGRIASARGRSAHLWMAGGSLAMGTGIWSMHFIGMLAFELPIELGYNLALTLLSLLIAVGSAGFALWLTSRATLPWPQLAVGAAVLGAGMAGMHYMGMAAMRLSPSITYDAVLFAASLLIAVGASAVGLIIAYRLRRHVPYVRVARAGAAVVLGLAIVGMHYTGMAAARFPMGSVCGALERLNLNGDGLVYLVIVTTFSVLAIALLTSVLDARLEARTADLAQSLTAANRQLTRLALHDNLTGLPNRILLSDRIAQAMQQAHQHSTCFALMFIDLDGFKPINDAFGHYMGDQLLLAVTRRLCAGLSAQATLARMGADEFVLLVPLRRAGDAVAAAAAQVLLLAEPFWVSEHSLRVSASIGVVLYPGGGADPHQLLVNADAAMYHAKHNGKNMYCFFDASMKSNARRQLDLIQDLRTASARGEFRLFYQPKFDAISGHAVGAEALLRWQHPQLGLLGPDTFIDLAEKTGLIVSIGEWVLGEACRQMAEWYRLGYTQWRMAVNLSAVQFGYGGLVDSVAHALANSSLCARNLTLEITETTAMQNVEASMAILQQLADREVDIAIDDFGTGYSSLMYLKRLPASELKIDRGFVRDLHQGSEDAAIVSAIVAVGQALGLRIVAEGVETEAQRAFLTRLGCDSLQGHLLGRPLPADAFIAHVRSVAPRAAHV
ncbi:MULTISPECIES: putative bifunctional diguanylate cyclase/phosphodiesterase [Pseudomonas]|uniref:EAL domain-containing protein n=1 Tax=Pseudomonas quercus TaxID=2722792 RepID=A0ABX0Y8H2_9PSED|nr:MULTISPECIES: EAL domain-containing protein [Pseudomonas]MBF7141076.1 EAL domain-containing protein [Pseudomonas sp. LY10J]NJO99610.1 EAL domain-containing protein [Pseudomonas quercus]